MEYFAAPLTREQTAQMIEMMNQRLQEQGMSFLAMELKATGEFIGMNGLNRPGHQLPFTPCVEVGWRLAHEHWGKGYAQEGARAALRYGFETLQLPEIVSFTATGNARSRHVMERIGMAFDPRGDFDHPAVPEGHAVRRHVLYRLANPRSGSA